jgi:hypothetical protein
MSSGTGEHITRLWGAAPDDVHAVGMNGILLHYDGSVWTPTTSGTEADLFGVWGDSSGNVFVVGKAGTILRGGRSTP